MYDPTANSISQKASVAKSPGAPDDTLLAVSLALKPFPEARAAVIAALRKKLGLFQSPSEQPSTEPQV